MSTITADFASTGVTFGFLIISLIAGVAVGIAATLLGTAGSLARGIGETLAGCRPRGAAAKGRATAVFIRVVFYAIAGCAALVLSSAGYTWVGNLLGILSAFCLGVAAVRFVSRL